MAKINDFQRTVEVTLIFPHQLFWPHPALVSGVTVHLLEVPLFFGRDPRWRARFHQQKLVLYRASLLAYASRLRELNYTVAHHFCPRSPTETTDLLEGAVPRNVTQIHLADPVDDWLRADLDRWAAGRRAKLTFYPSPNFLSPAEFLDAQFPSKRKPLLARFYEAQRKRMGVLIEPDGTPTGGRWSFDTENRRRLPKQAVIPAMPTISRTPWVESAREKIQKEFPEAIGDSQAFAYPTTHTEAAAWLDHFLEWRLASFGDFEDAIATRHSVLFHSVLTPCLNLGLLSPNQIVARVQAHAARNAIPLNSLEGFLRQVIGWREFMRAIYERRGRSMRVGNFWKFHRPLPAAFYTATTGIEPVDHVIRQVLETGYCHHIERLMILGNFLLLCRIHPDEVYRWFMEMFVDAYDWVMVPNVYGMSQFADGGGFTTKPYLSGSNYVRKMSDFPEGPWCEIWDALFWTFVADYSEVFRKNPRMSMMAVTAAKLGPKLDAHRQTADAFLKKLNLIET